MKSLKIGRIRILHFYRRYSHGQALNANTHYMRYSFTLGDFLSRASVMVGRESHHARKHLSALANTCLIAMVIKSLCILHATPKTNTKLFNFTNAEIQ